MKTVYLQVPGGEFQPPYTDPTGQLVITSENPVFTSLTTDTKGDKKWGKSPFGGRFVMCPSLTVDDEVFHYASETLVEGALLESALLPYVHRAGHPSGKARLNVAFFNNLLIRSVRDPSELSIQVFALRTFPLTEGFENISAQWLQNKVDRGDADLKTNLNRCINKTLELAGEVAAAGWKSVREQHLRDPRDTSLQAHTIITPFSITSELGKEHNFGNSVGQVFALDDYLSAYRQHLYEVTQIPPEEVGETMEITEAP